jgi:hypothetical protein
MKIASARSLKLEMLETFPKEAPLPQGVTRVVGARALRSGMLRGSHVGGPSEMSIGVAQGKNPRDYRVGVRIHAKGARAEKLAAECEKRSRGEADVRIVPRVVAGPPARDRARRANKATAKSAWFQKRRRPLEAGLSAGHVDITAGTLGFVVEDDDAYYVLSNNHVLANVNAGTPGDLVVQPGPDDGRVSAKTIIGVLDRFVPISFKRSNVVDCAVASILESLEFFAGWTEALPGVVRGVRRISEDDLGLTVKKAGRTTGVTRGTISQVELDRLRVDMSDSGSTRVASFSDQFEVIGDDGKPFSLGGDSGAVIVDEDGFALGLLFAGGPDDQGVDLTFANHLETALSKLGVRLAL